MLSSESVDLMVVDFDICAMGSLLSLFMSWVMGVDFDLSCSSSY